VSEAARRETPRHTRLRVRYADTDKMGVVYYANYLVWFEVARTEWLRESGWTYRDMEAEGFALPVIEAHCRYRRPARYDDEIELRTTAAAVTAVRIRFDYHVHHGGDGTALATGHTVHAVLDGMGRPRRLPPRVQALLGEPGM
jgi:acyl-CoA thioester hydrolase